MTEQLHRDGIVIGHNRIRRLMRLMGLTTVYPKPGTSVKHPEHKIYPYLLRDVRIERVDQVCSADITYIRLFRGFVYLVAILDWFSDMCCHGQFKRVLIRCSVSMCWTRHWKKAGQKYLIRTRAASLPAMTLPASSKMSASVSAWMVKGEFLIISLSSVFGGQSNMRKFI